LADGIGAERVDFIALPVSDLAGADDFYGQTVGLARNPNTSGDRWIEYETGNLTIALSTFGGTIGLCVSDVEEARQKVEVTGIEFHRDTFDSGVCNGAPFSDPDGNSLLLHRRYAPLERFDIPTTEVQRTDFIGVNVKDREQAADFYGRTVGLKRNPLSSDEWPEFETGNVGFVLSTPEQKGGGEFRPEYSIAFRVPDVAEGMERLRERDVEFEFDEPYDSGVCQMAFFRDPDGNALMLHHRYAPYRDGTKP
jgi:predicted enzyme related to lactoylglutathione lyase